MNGPEKPPKKQVPISDSDLTDEQLLAIVTAERGLPDERTDSWDIDSIEAERSLTGRELTIGRVVEVNGRTRYIRSDPYYDAIGRLVIDVVLRKEDIDNPKPRRIEIVPVANVKLTRRRETSAQRMARLLAEEKAAQGETVLTRDQIRYGKMTQARREAIAANPSLAEYVKKFPRDASIVYGSIFCTVQLSPYMHDNGQIVVKIKADNPKKAGFSTRIVLASEIELFEDYYRRLKK